MRIPRDPHRRFHCLYTYPLGWRCSNYALKGEAYCEIHRCSLARPETRSPFSSVPAEKEKSHDDR